MNARKIAHNDAQVNAPFAASAILTALLRGRRPVLHVARRHPAARVMQTVLIALLRFYKLAVSPMLGNRCRFYPSCSDYAREAIQYHGAAHGTYLAARRLCRCHPFSAGGIDLVPPPTSEKR